MSVTTTKLAFGTACRVTAEDTTDVTDFVPAAVQEIQFLELNAKLQTLQQEVRRGSFCSNDKVHYTSVLAVKDEFDEDTLPAAVQVNMRGVNSIEQPLQMYWIIRYDNDCGVFPLLEVGQKEGWSIFVSTLFYAYMPCVREDSAMPRNSILMPKVLAIALTDGSWFAARVCVSLGGRPRRSAIGQSFSVFHHVGCTFHGTVYFCNANDHTFRSA